MYINKMQKSGINKIKIVIFIHGKYQFLHLKCLILFDIEAF